MKLIDRVIGAAAHIGLWPYVPGHDYDLDPIDGNELADAEARQEVWEPGALPTPPTSWADLSHAIYFTLAQHLTFGSDTGCSCGETIDTLNPPLMSEWDWAAHTTNKILTTLQTARLR